MPARKPVKEAASNFDGNWRGFVNITLTDEEFAIIDKEMKDAKINSTVPGHIDYLLELGKVSFTYTNGSLVVSLTISEGAQKGFTVSSFSDSVVEALLITRLKVQNYLADFETIFAGGGVKKKRG